jgi:hypothetical protein
MNWVLQINKTVNQMVMLMMFKKVELHMGLTQDQKGMAMMDSFPLHIQDIMYGACNDSLKRLGVQQYSHAPSEISMRY